MSKNQLEDLLLMYEDVPFQKLTGFDDCIVGVVETTNFGPSLCYNEGKVIQKLIDTQNISREEAVEFFGYNIRRSAIGENLFSFVFYPL